MIVFKHIDLPTLSTLHTSWSSGVKKTEDVASVVTRLGDGCTVNYTYDFGTSTECAVTFSKPEVCLV
jgi:hypothetical protein